ncbi:hypothetical protein SISNIDRAFT_503030 [Sistotremastrum niveocremeum HHB9708]|uniref:Uncharacterized protein n=1 Tax=Sistotremastrum niveocremeum HHB9708 TaxID=1314777 RepID=A0A164VQU9_9AGAM|nr:hypothetical protein SISNIDRAFT_503030 [Sistotremastrum niveocremeum HHB9708]
MEQDNNMLLIHEQQDHQDNLTAVDRQRMTFLAELTLLHQRCVAERGEPIPSHWLEDFPGYEQTDDTYFTWRIRLMKYLSEGIRINHDYPPENLPTEPIEGAEGAEEAEEAEGTEGTEEAEGAEEAAGAEGVEAREVPEGPVMPSLWQAMPSELIREVLRIPAEQGMAEGLSSKAHTKWHLLILTTTRWLEVALDFKTLWAAIDFTQPDALVAAIRDFCQNTPITHIRHDISSLEVNNLEDLRTEIGVDPENVTDLSLTLNLSQIQVFEEFLHLANSPLTRTPVPALQTTAPILIQLFLSQFHTPLYASLSPALDGCNDLQDLSIKTLDLAKMTPTTLILTLKNHCHLRIFRAAFQPQSRPMIAPEAEAAIEAAELPQPGDDKIVLDCLEYLGLGALSRRDVDTTLRPFTFRTQHKVELLVLPEDFVNHDGDLESQFLLPTVLHPHMARASYLKVTTRHALMTVTYGNADFTHTIFGVSLYGVRHRRPRAGALHWPSRTCEEIAQRFQSVEFVEVYGILPSAEQWRLLLENVVHHSHLAVFGSTADELLPLLRHNPHLGHGIREIRLWLLDYDDPLNPDLPDPPDEVIDQHMARAEDFATLANAFFRVNNKQANPVSTLTTRFYSNNAERLVEGETQSTELSAADTRTIFPAQNLNEDGWIEDSPWYWTCLPPDAVTVYPDPRVSFLTD